MNGVMEELTVSDSKQEQETKSWRDIDTSDWPELELTDGDIIAEEFRKGMVEELREAGWPWPRLGETSEKFRERLARERQTE